MKGPLVWGLTYLVWILRVQRTAQPVPLPMYRPLKSRGWRGDSVQATGPLRHKLWRYVFPWRHRVRHIKSHKASVWAYLQALRRVSGESEAAVPDVSHDRRQQRLMNSGSSLSWRSRARRESSESTCQGLIADGRTGFFSEVWRGSWQGIPVAIKQLDPTADKKVIHLTEVDLF